MVANEAALLNGPLLHAYIKDAAPYSCKGFKIDLGGISQQPKSATLSELSEWNGSARLSGCAPPYVHRYESLGYARITTHAWESNFRSDRQPLLNRAAPINE